MKKLTRRSFTAAGIIAALSAGLTSLAGCDLDLAGCSMGDVSALYGPPPEIDPSDNEIVDVYGPPDVDPSDWDDPSTWDNYDPEDNDLIEVYGPPAGVDDDDDYDADDNIAVTLYGPPDVDPSEWGD